MTEQLETLSPEQISEYLSRHPEFFNDHLDLLENLFIPHPSGNAVSLIAKQLELLRNRNQEMEAQLASLIEIAKTNDISFSRTHHLTLALLAVSTLEDAIASLEAALAEHFMTDFLAVRILADAADNGVPGLCLVPDVAVNETLQPIFASKLPLCGRPTLAQAKLFFGEAALDVESAALIPMKIGNRQGVLAIGSRKNDRFHHSMGNFFLTLISEIVGARLASLLPP